jgi:hypothetical protein
MDRTTPTVTDTRRLPDPLCRHTPKCPSADSPDREAAHVVAAHPEQGWSLLCNGVLVFEDTGELLPDGRAVAPRRPMGATQPFQLAATYALIGGTARSGKTDAAAALLQAPAVVTTSSTSRSA